MSTEIAPRDDLHTRMEYAKALAVSDLLPAAYRGKPANVLVAIEYGRALGIEPMAAIQGVSVIQGKPTASAQLVGALVRRAGHRLRIIKHDSGAVEAQIIRRDDPEFTFRAVWTMERAKAAGLTGKGGSWQTFPVAMLTARAVTEVAREACPDVLAGVAYTEEELESIPSGSPQRVSTTHLSVPQTPESPPAPGVTPTGTDATVVDGSDADAEVVEAELLDVDTDSGEVLR